MQNGVWIPSLMNEKCLHLLIPIQSHTINYFSSYSSLIPLKLISMELFGSLIDLEFPYVCSVVGVNLYSAVLTGFL